MREKLRVGITSYLHFLVDFTCAYWMFYIVFRQCLFPGCPVGEGWTNYGLAWILVYNFCAFALQLPLSWLADRYFQQKSWRLSSVGCLVLAIAGGLIFGEGVLQIHIWKYPWDIEITPYSWTYYSGPHGFFYSILLGIGNALFHVGAGIEVLRLSEKGGRRTAKRRGKFASVDGAGFRMAPVGIFVSSGAFGLCLGRVMSEHLKTVYLVKDYGKVILVYLMLVIGLMLAAAGLNILVTGMPGSAESHFTGIQGFFPVQNKNEVGIKQEYAESSDESWNLWIILLLFLVVVLRSFQGGAMQFFWYDGMVIALVFAFCVSLGKALGGILADRIGIWWTVLFPLGCSAVIFWLFSDSMLPGLAAVLLFQTTMPITLSLMYRQIPRHPGLAFGLLSFGLFLGDLPKTMSRSQINGEDFRLWNWFGQLAAKGIAWEPICSLVAVISLILLVVVFCLWKRTERPGG